MFPAVGFAHAELAATVVLVASVLLAVMLWGVGLWWLAHGVLSLLARYLYGGMRFSIAMWGCVARRCHLHACHEDPGPGTR